MRQTTEDGGRLQRESEIRADLRRALLVKQALIEYRRELMKAEDSILGRVAVDAEKSVAYNVAAGLLWTSILDVMVAQDQRMVEMERRQRNLRNEDWSGWDGEPHREERADEGRTER